MPEPTAAEPGERERPVGRVPAGRDPDGYDRTRRRALWSLPSGLYLVGTAGAQQRNLMTANWVTQVALDPKLVAVSIEAGAVSRRLADEGGAFAVSVLARADRAVVRRYAKPAEDDRAAGTIGGLSVRTAASGAPYLDAAVAWLDCEVREAVACGSHVLYVGEVVDAGLGAVDPAEVEVLRMEDTRMSYGG